jgi:hypothetical protein
MMREIFGGRVLSTICVMMVSGDLFKVPVIKILLVDFFFWFYWGCGWLVIFGG